METQLKTTNTMNVKSNLWQQLCNKKKYKTAFSELVTFYETEYGLPSLRSQQIHVCCLWWRFARL